MYIKISYTVCPVVNSIFNGDIFPSASTFGLMENAHKVHVIARNRDTSENCLPGHILVVVSI